MNRQNFLAAFTAAPLAFVSEEGLESIQKEDTICVVMNVNGVTKGLGFHLDDFKDDLMRAFQELMRAAESDFVADVIMHDFEL